MSIRAESLISQFLTDLEENVAMEDDALSTVSDLINEYFGHAIDAHARRLDMDISNECY